MKITMLSEIDYAASGHRLCEAIRKHTKHDIEIFTGKYYNPYKHNDNSTHNRRQVQQRINESDIVHLKGDWPPKDGYMNLKIMHKPIIVSVSGSHFRKKPGGHGKYNRNQYKTAKVRTAFTPDLCYPEYSDTWTPHPIDSDVQAIEWQRSDPPVLMHMPTNKAVKGTEFIYEVFKALQRKRKVKIMILENLNFKEAVEIRKKATIFFDQFVVGFYGNSAIEAMQYGIPVAAWINQLSLTQAKDRLHWCPVITARKTVNDWVNRIEKILDSDMQVISMITKQWCDYIHGYHAVATQWDKIYNAV